MINGNASPSLENLLDEEKYTQFQQEFGKRSNIDPDYGYKDALIERAAGGDISLEEAINQGLANLHEIVESGNLPTIIHPHAFGLQTNTDGDLLVTSDGNPIPNEEAQWVMLATLELIRFFLRRDPNWHGHILFSAGLYHIHGISYAEANHRFFIDRIRILDKYRTLNNKAPLLNRVTTYIIPKGVEALGEMEAARLLQHKFAEETEGEIPRVAEIQLAPYMRKLYRFIRNEGFEVFTPLNAEAIFLYLRPNILQQIINAGKFTEVEKRELKKQVTALAIDTLDPMGIAKWLLETFPYLSRLKEKGLGR